MVIYKTTNLINGKIYIGQDSNNNPTYLGSGKTLIKSIKKYGRDNFKKEILETCSSRKELDEREIFWINNLNSRNRDIGYNITPGGNEGDRSIGLNIFKNGVYNHWVEKFGEEEANNKLEVKKEKLSKFNKVNPNTLIKEGRYNYWVEKFGEEEANNKLGVWKRKISTYQKNKMLSGWTHSDEAKSKISESSKNRIISEETKMKLRKPKPPGFGGHLHVKVNQLTKEGDFIKTWDSITSAEKELLINGISRVLSGGRKTCGGFKWVKNNKI